VPPEKIRNRIPRTLQNISKALPLVDSARLLDNSSRENPFKQIAVVRLGRKRILTEPVPDWALEILRDIPG
jgi:predicted ABC-type ATPase